MTVRAEVLADSINKSTHSRLTTMRVTCPRPLWDEFLTHRLFARCAASMRAVPLKRQRATVRADPYIPAFGENKAGMQQGAPLGFMREKIARFLWLASMHVALFLCFALEKLGAHKQNASRLLFPFCHITAIVTGTDAAYVNFYDLRRHPMAEPTIHALADVMADVHRKSIPRLLSPGEWHLPLAAAGEVEAIKRSVARVARISYNKPDGTPSSLAEDEAMHDRLLGAAPMHASPAEHQAQATDALGSTGRAGCFGPYSGWVQYRKTLRGEVSTRALSEAIA